MEKLKIITSQNVSIEYSLAGVGERIIASIIDYLVLGGYYLIFILGFQIADISPETVHYILVSIPAMMYSFIFEAAMNGQTLGMKQRKIKVIRLDGKEVGIGNYLIRWLFRLVDVALCFGGIATLMIAFTEKGQRIGDIVAGTTVVKMKDQQLARETLFPVIDPNYQPKFPSVARLSDQEISLIRETLTRYQKTKSPGPSEVLSNKLKNILDIHHTMPGPRFLEVVLKDHMHLTQE